jgi:uncharacterized membrane protein
MGFAVVLFLKDNSFIPTLNEWGVIILLLGMFGATFYMMRKQHSI